MCPARANRAVVPGAGSKSSPNPTRTSDFSARCPSAAVYSGSAGWCFVVPCRFRYRASSSWR